MESAIDPGGGDTAVSGRGAAGAERPRPVGWGTQVFAVACGVIAIHVLSDALAGREPGVAAEEQVVPAFVPVAILIGAAVAYPRLPPGVQALLALSLGLLGLVGGGIAIAHIAIEGAGAEDVSGLVVLAAGLVLCAQGAALLWVTRKREGRVVLRRSLIALGAALYGFEIILPIALALVVTHRPAESPGPGALGRPSEEVTVRTQDGLRLSGLYVPSRNGAAVITFPSSEGTAPEARMLAENGFGVLALDMRGYGSSQGEPNALGWEAAADIDAGVSFLRNRHDVDGGRIGGLGLSVGGEQMIEAAADNPGLRAVVSEGAGERSVRETLIFGPAAALVLPQQTVLTIATAAFSGNSPPKALDELVAEIAPRPTFLIYAENGQGGEELNEDYFEAAGEPKQLWRVPSAGHTGGLSTAAEEYERRVVGFFRRWLDPDAD